MMIIEIGNVGIFASPDGTKIGTVSRQQYGCIRRSRDPNCYEFVVSCQGIEVRLKTNYLFCSNWQSKF